MSINDGDADVKVNSDRQLRGNIFMQQFQELYKQSSLLLTVI